MTLASMHLSMQNPNVLAFLKAIRLGEGTEDELGYNRIVGGGHFDSNEHHPNVRVFIPRYNVWSTAAGAYQITAPTWRGLVKQYGFPDFTPESQDLGAVALISEVNALSDVISGRLDIAVQKCSREWASLPGSESGQRTEKFAEVQRVYQANGGTIA